MGQAEGKGLVHALHGITGKQTFPFGIAQYARSHVQHEFIHKVLARKA